MSSFREISNVLDIISLVLRCVTFGLILIQAILLIKDTKNGFAHGE